MTRSYRDDVLAALPGSIDEIAQRTRLGVTTVRRWLKTFCETGEAHFTHEVPKEGGGPPTAFYDIGEGAPVPAPEPKPVPKQTWFSPLEQRT